MSLCGFFITGLRTEVSPESPNPKESTGLLGVPPYTPVRSPIVS